MSASLVERLQDKFPNLECKSEFPLSKLTYMKTGGPAEVLVSITDISQFIELVHWLQSEKISWYVLGGASNVLVPDAGLRGVVIQNRCTGYQLSWESHDTAVIEVESGHLTGLFVRKTMDSSLTGAEVFLGVPGTIGGAIYNNSHYMDQLISEILVSVTYLDENSQVVESPVDELEFGYDTSIFHLRKCVILKGVFRLRKGDPVEIQTKMLDATKKRASTQPLGEPSSGCMFKNYAQPDGSLLSVGKIIDELGLKGEKVGGAVVSDIHANFIVNTGSATTADILQLAEKIEQKVLEKRGFKLEREVFLLDSSTW